MHDLIPLKSEAIEAGIRFLGGVQKVDFTTASGHKANSKVELDVLNKSGFIRSLVKGALVDLALPYEADLLIPMPTGADEIGKDTAYRLGIECALLRWVDKTPGHKKLVHKKHEDLNKIRVAKRIILFDDVFRTGSTLIAAYNKPNIGEKTVAALSIWDRSDGVASRNFPVPLLSIVRKYIPLNLDEV